MKDYISRDEAIEFVKSVVSTMSVCVNKDEWIGMDSMKKRAILALKDVPAADVRENVHAHWYRYSYDEAVCTHCSYVRGTPFESTKEAKQSWKTLPPFCEMCNAIMDEEDKDALSR